MTVQDSGKIVHRRLIKALGIAKILEILWFEPGIVCVLSLTCLKNVRVFRFQSVLSKFSAELLSSFTEWF